MGSPFAPNEVPAPVLQRRWLESRYHVRTAHEIFKVQSSPEKKNTAHAAQWWFCRVNRRQNESGVLRGGWSFRDNPRRGRVQNEHDRILWRDSGYSTKSVEFTRKIPRYVECVKRILKNLLCKIEKSTTHSIFLLPLQAAFANFCKGAWPKWSSVSSCS